MKKVAIISLLIFVASSQFAFADTIRSKVTGANMPGLKTNIVDPDNHVYGIPWGTSEDEFIKDWGEPIGYVRFNMQDTGKIYGSRHMFIFHENKLSGIRITHGVLDWQLSKKLLPNPLFDAIQWELNNGIKEETNLTRVKKFWVLHSQMKDTKNTTRRNVRRSL